MPNSPLTTGHFAREEVDFEGFQLGCVVGVEKRSPRAPINAEHTCIHCGLFRRRNPFRFHYSGSLRL